jgi:arsenite methyltransferase
MDFKEINKRYSDLADSSCCLSCGGAIKYANVEPGQTCIDLGSGRGTDAIRLAEKTGENGMVYGIDISEGMIRKSRETAKKLGIGNVNFISCCLEKLEIEDNAGDLIISNCTINHSADKQSVWNEVHRVLKPGGRFIVSDIYSLQTVPEQYRNDPVAVAECWAGATTREEYLDHLKNAGFSSVEVIEESAPYEKGQIMVASWTISGMKN